MERIYTEEPRNWAQLEPYVNRNSFREDIFDTDVCFFYDACSFRYHANMDEKAAESFFAYVKSRNGMIVLTRCVLMELASHSGVLNEEYIRYAERISRCGIRLHVIFEEEVFSVMEVCFATNAAVNDLLKWAVRMIKAPLSTITRTLEENESLSDEIFGRKNNDSGTHYERFFRAVRANKEEQDNLGEELLAVCVHILSHLPGERDGKYCILTDDKGAAGKIDMLFRKTDRQHRGSRIILFSTPKLAQTLVVNGQLTDRGILEAMLHAGNNGNLKLLGTQIYDLKSTEISLSCAEAADQILGGGIQISF